MSNANVWDQQREQRSSKPWAIGVATAIGVAVLTLMIAFLCLVLVIRSVDLTSVIENNLRFGYLLWAILVTIAVFVVFYLVPRLTPTGSVQFWLGVAVVGYLLNLFSWGGTAIGIRNVLGLGEFGASPGLGLTVVGWILDLAVWLGVAALAITLSGRRSSDRVSTKNLS